jgi:hypothetical protein
MWNEICPASSRNRNFFVLFIGEQPSERFEESVLHMGRKRRDKKIVRISNYVLIRKIIQQKKRKMFLKHKHDGFFDSLYTKTGAYYNVSIVQSMYLISDNGKKHIT